MNKEQLDEKLKKMDVSYMLTPEARAAFFPCKTCSNIMTNDCFYACMPELRFSNYRHRPGTDINELPMFPIQEILEEPDAQVRLVSVCIYLMAVVDYLQHTDEYLRNRELYDEEKKNGKNNGRNVESSRCSNLSASLEGAAVRHDSEKRNPPHPSK